MSVVINLLGGPSVGKSTKAAELYSEMKKRGLKVELVREFAKEWAWEGRTIGPFDQMAIIGEQIRRESSLFGKVDYIITDSPAILGAFYMDYNHNQEYMTKMVKDYLSFSEDQDVVFRNVVLPRHTNYIRSGRFETEEQAKTIDYSLTDFLSEQKIRYEYYYEDLIDEIVNPRPASGAW
jgi:nicotinamide riboside kinase